MLRSVFFILFRFDFLIILGFYSGNFYLELVFYNSISWKLIFVFFFKEVKDFFSKKIVRFVFR